MRRVVFLLFVAVGVLTCAFGHPTSERAGNDVDAELSEVEEDEGEDTTEEQKTNDEGVDEIDDDESTDDGENPEKTADDEEETSENEGDEEYEDETQSTKTVVYDKSLVTTQSPQSKVLATGDKKRRKVKNNGPSKKMASKLLPLLLIPLMIQAQLIPMMLLKLKMLALKALFLGKAALIIIILNVVRNAFIGASSMEEQYEQQTLASSHYGYTGSPEYGAWVNKRRVFQVNSNSPYRGHELPAVIRRESATTGRTMSSKTAPNEMENT